MKGRDFERYAKRYLVPGLQDLIPAGRYLFLGRIGWLLTGFCLDASVYGRGSYLYDVSMPMYEPNDFLRLDHGARLGGGSGRKFLVDPQNPEPVMQEMRRVIIQEGLPRLMRRATVERFTDFQREARRKQLADSEAPRNFWRLLDRPAPYIGPNAAQDLAFSLILTGAYTEAAEVLTQVRNQRAAYPSQERPAWVDERFDQLAEVEALLLGSSALAIEKLKEYRRYTLGHLKLEQWAVPDDELPLPLS